MGPEQTYITYAPFTRCVCIMHMVRTHIVHCAFASCAGYICTCISTMLMVQMHNAIGACAWLTRLVFGFLGSPGFESSWLAWVLVSIVAEIATHVFLRSRALESVRSEAQNLPSHPSQSQPTNPNPTPQLPPLCPAPPTHPRTPHSCSTQVASPQRKRM